MGNFKEVKLSTNPIPVNPDLRELGGIDIKDGIAIKPPSLRLRLKEEGENQEVLPSDITHIRLHPKELKPEAIIIPPLESIQVGEEREFTVIDAGTGLPKNLYGGQRIIKIGEEIYYLKNEGDGQPIIDHLSGAGPEALRFQLETGAKPRTSPTDQSLEVGLTIKEIINQCWQRGALLLPTGRAGYPLSENWGNITPHPYIVKIHQSLGGTAIAFDAQTFQVHVDLSPFAKNKEVSIEFALLIGNLYNELFASMLHGISTSAPFAQGRITDWLSTREFARKRLKTAGGIQTTDFPIDHRLFFGNANTLMQSGEIPVPERAGPFLNRRSRDVGNGSHNDYRPKISVGTGEFGSTDMHPNHQLITAVKVVLRRFVHQSAQQLKNGEPFPAFMLGVSGRDRWLNRLNTSFYGHRAPLKTGSGIMSMRDAWQNMFEWLGFNRIDLGLEELRAHVAVMKSLNTQIIGNGIKAIEQYFNPNQPEHYLQGNFAEAMLEFTKALPPRMTEPEKIAATNLEIARRYREYVLNDY